ncbi:MAG: dipicolinate synthase subunit DpsA [Peptococcales bacterium]|jgi:dipicolinate synthase subunit A
MAEQLIGITIGVVGGDERQIFLINKLLELKAEVKVIGLPERRELQGCKFYQDLSEAIQNVNSIILPMAGTDFEGKIITTFSKMKIQLTEDIFQSIPGNVPIFLGVAKPFLKEWARFYQKTLIEIANLDEIAIPNSIPTAEACLQIAMEKLPITIHGSNTIIIGFGRCGKTLARMFQALGARTTVVARKLADIARAKEMVLNAYTYEELPELLPSADLIINTVPIQILTEKRLTRVNKDVLIIDIASAPGGTDFSAAEKLGIQAILTPSLPGLVAPKTAGLILAEILPKLILKEISLPEKSEVGGKIS